LFIATHFLLEQARNRHKDCRSRYLRHGLATCFESYRNWGWVVYRRENVFVGGLLAFAETGGIGLDDAVLCVAGD
jgi:hypothetical protein